MTEFRGSLDASGVRTAIVVARWNDFITERLLEGAVACLQQAGAPEPDVIRVPGSFEIPLAALVAAETGRYDAVICLGCVIRGETAHFEYVSSGATSGVLEAGLRTGVPVIFGVLTTENEQQARERAGDATSTLGQDGQAKPQTSNKGFEAAETALEMASVLRQLRRGSTLDIPGELMQRVQAEAALHGRSPQDYMLKAINDRLLHDHDKRLGIAKPARPETAR